MPGIIERARRAVAYDRGVIHDQHTDPANDVPIRQDDKDRPLLLRRRRGGLYLTTPTFPPRHEFRPEWMIEYPECQFLPGDLIILTLANATAAYRVRRDWMTADKLDDNGNIIGEQRLSTGYWGVLIEESYDKETTNG